MSGPLERRLIALERVNVARRLVFRVYATEAEAKADTEPEPWGVMVQGIITGVPRSPDASIALAGKRPVERDRSSSCPYLTAKGRDDPASMLSI